MLTIKCFCDFDAFGYPCVISGIGASLTYLPSIIIISEYFDIRLGIALGLSSAGFGIGTFSLPQLMEYLFENYG